MEPSIMTNGNGAAPCRWNRALQLPCFMELLLTQIAAWGDFDGFYFVVNRTPHGLPITRWVPLTS
jgi:hypothetical protein